MTCTGVSARRALCPTASPRSATSLGRYALARDVAPDRIEQAANAIVRRLETSGQSEFNSTEIGGLVMQTLKQMDEVAYVRYASVYRNFREVEEFERAVESLRDGDRVS